jgi:hypothetical protein
MMPSDKDIFGKADALLRRHSATGSDTGVFPVLTELIDDPAKAGATEALAGEIFARVMAEVEARLAVDLEKRIGEQLVPHVHAAIEGTIADLREELVNAIREAVAAALERRNVK